MCMVIELDNSEKEVLNQKINIISSNKITLRIAFYTIVVAIWGMALSNYSIQLCILVPIVTIPLQYVYDGLTRDALRLQAVLTYCDREKNNFNSQYREIIKALNYDTKNIESRLRVPAIHTNLINCVICVLMCMKDISKSDIVLGFCLGVEVMFVFGSLVAAMIIFKKSRDGLTMIDEYKQKLGTDKSGGGSIEVNR